jgi:glycosyltransferase involved in cell wall biosynthesis
MSLRIGVVVGTSDAKIGGSWTFTNTLVDALKSTQFSHEFLLLDEFLQPASSHPTPSRPPGLSQSRLAASVGLMLLQRSLRSWLEDIKEPRQPALFEYLRSVGSWLKNNKEPRQPAVFEYLQQALVDYLARTDVAMPEYLQQTPLERLEHIIQRKNLDLIWYMTPNGIPISVPFIATVFDLEHRKQPYFPEVSTMDWTWMERESNYDRLLPRAALVLTGTEQGKTEIIQYYHVNPALVRVVPLPTLPLCPVPPSHAAAAVAKNHGIIGDFLLYPAQFWPHKNHVNLLLGLDELRREHDLHPKLVLTGSDRGNRNHVHKLVSELHLSEQVFDLGFVSREDLTSLYARARAMVYPSFFGPDNLPPLEAFATACPVIAADVPGAREQLGRGALYFNPCDPRHIAAKIAEVLLNEGCRQQLVDEAMKIVRQRTPRAYISAVCEFLDGFEPIRRCWGLLAPAPILTEAGLSFARGEEGVVALKEGWGEPESWGTWSVQERCVLRLNLRQFARRPLCIAFACRTFQYRALQIGCYVENGPIQRWNFAAPQGEFFATQEPKGLCRLRINPEDVPPSGDVNITFLISDAASLAELGLSADLRRLGLGLERMWAEES